MIIVLVALAGVYGFCFTGWFKPQIIHISHTSRASRMRLAGNAAGEPAIFPVTFSFDREYIPTEIKVVPLAAWQTNQNVLPVWHLVADTDAAPIKIFIYGQQIRGMKSEMPGAHAEPLEPGVTYRLFVTAGAAKGQHDFQARAAD